MGSFPRWLSGNPRFLPAVAAFIIITFGALARLTALDWDAMAGLHADERHMAFMVIDAQRGLKAWAAGTMPLSWTHMWFDSVLSPLNPRQLSGFYVYGEAPMLLVAFWLAHTGWQDWTDAILYGRLLSALADCATMLLVFFIAARWSVSRWVPVFACGFYAAAPVALREAHFFTVDTLSTAFGVAAVYVASLWQAPPTLRRNGALAVLMGILLGLSVASKLSGAVFFAAVFFVICARLWVNRDWRFSPVAGQAFLCLFAALVTFRLANPFAFVGPSFWGVAIEPRFLDDVAEQSRLANAGTGWVPNWYWFERPPFPQLLSDMFFWGLGPCFAISIVLGIVLGRRRLSLFHFAGAAFVVAVMMVLATYPTPYLRYILPIVPFFAILAAALIDGAARYWRFALAAVLLFGSALQAQAVVGMLMAPHTRVEASAYIWETEPSGSVVLNEAGWDETLPAVIRLPGDKEARWPFAPGAYILENLQIQEPDTPAKVRRMAALLAKSDLLVESSQRFFRVMPRMSLRFPMTSRYYQMLEDGGLCFEKLREFHRVLNIAGLFDVDDSSAQESWFIYDHPIVRIFKRRPCFDQATIERELLEALPQ